MITASDGASLVTIASDGGLYVADAAVVGSDDVSKGGEADAGCGGRGARDGKGVEVEAHVADVDGPGLGGFASVAES